MNHRFPYNKLGYCVVAFFSWQTFVTATTPYVSMAIAASTPSLSLGSPESLLAGSGKDGTNTIKSMLERTNKMSAYSFESVLSTYKDGKLITETGRLYYKSPNLLRFEVLKAGRRSGSVVVRQPDGRIRGKMGGPFSGIKVTLSPDSKLLRAANDFSVLESDLGSLLSVAVQKLGKHQSCVVGHVPGLHDQIVELVSDDGSVVSRIRVNANSKLPEEWSIFKDKKLYSTAKFANLKALSDLPDSLFSLDTQFGPAEPGNTEPGKAEPLLPLPGGKSPFLIASERNSSVSLADYRLRLKELNEMAMPGEVIAEELKSVLSSNQEDLRLSIVNTAVSALRKSAGTISGLPVAEANGQETTWVRGSQQKLLIEATQMELLLSALDPIGSSLDTDASHELSKSWEKTLNSCRQTLWRLYDQVESDHPDLAALGNIKSKLYESSEALYKISEQRELNK